MFDLSLFDFAAVWSPDWIIASAGIGLLYFLIVNGPLRQSFPNAKRVPLPKQLSFYTGLFCLYLVMGGPFDLLGHFMFSIHMTKMAIMYLIVPPLMIYGMPDWFFLGFERWNRLRKVFRFFTHPILSVLLFTGFFSLYHMPFVFDLSMTNAYVRTLYNTVLLVTAFFSWWPLMSPLPSRDETSDFKKIGYLYMGAFLLLPSCALIVFGETPYYKTYTDPQTWATALGLCVSGDPAALLASFGGPEQFSKLTPLLDQRVGGIIMKVMQEIVYGIVLTYVYYKWVAKEKAREAEEQNLANQPHGYYTQVQ
ncbi:cytochrome c oxidase assembly factor CtaG [Brevibacillus marinus]|uniref:cytochrome c oxidase assembly factor CtaG n=1 Tax=Brevibacillus marinus TaxID=2496837 RepID=UPI0013E05FC2|nr:cytochrome c oxidase assembly factor CtaG [Brevibacillus marinus]